MLDLVVLKLDKTETVSAIISADPESLHLF